MEEASRKNARSRKELLRRQPREYLMISGVGPPEETFGCGTAAETTAALGLRPEDVKVRDEGLFDSITVAAKLVTSIYLQLPLLPTEGRVDG
jgi:hypothetical protein